MDEERKSLKKPIKPIERVTIADSLRDKLVRLTSQANEALQGIATLNKSNIINHC